MTAALKAEITQILTQRVEPTDALVEQLRAVSIQQQVVIRGDRARASAAASALKVLDNELHSASLKLAAEKQHREQLDSRCAVLENLLQDMTLHKPAEELVEQLKATSILHLQEMACVCEQKVEAVQQFAQVPTLQLVTIQMFFTNVHRCITKQKLANLMKRRRHKNNHV
jgi:hypothetical protein